MAKSTSRARSSSRSSSSRGSSSRRSSSRASSSRAPSSRAASAQTTTDHEEIRRWAEERGGKPACVKGTQRSDSCLLRIDFPGGAGRESLKQISWDDFFDTMDQRGLVFLYQDHKKNGEPSTFNKIVNAASAGQKSSRRGSSSGRLRGRSAGGKRRKSSARHGRGGE